MKITITMLVVLALVAVVVALFAWAVAKLQNAKPDRKPAVGNANRRFQRNAMRRAGKFHGARVPFSRFHKWLARQLALIPLLFHGFFRAFTPRNHGGIQFANIGEGSFEGGVKSYLIDVATASRYLCYKIGTDGDHAAVCGAGDTPLGQSDDVAVDVTIPIAINLFGLGKGTLRVVTDGTIANGDHVKCGAVGVVTKASSTDRSFGIAVIGTDTTNAAGDVITIIHCVPHLYVF